MEESRQGDCRVPLISSVFCVCLATGGVLLVMYCFTPSNSEPWFPIAAFIMISIPWIFWVFTYLYACAKVCFRPSNSNERQVSRRTFNGGGPSKNATTSQNTMAATNASIDDHEPCENSPKEGKHVQFAAVVVIDGENGHHEGGDSSVTSSKECEMPLNLGVSSS